MWFNARSKSRPPLKVMRHLFPHCMCLQHCAAPSCALHRPESTASCRLRNCDSLESPGCLDGCCGSHANTARADPCKFGAFELQSIAVPHLAFHGLVGGPISVCDAAFLVRNASLSWPVAICSASYLDFAGCLPLMAAPLFLFVVLCPACGYTNRVVILGVKCCW